MRTRFDQELERLNTEIIEMGGMIESAIGNAVTALVNQDVELARVAIESDREIDEMERQIERHCLRLLLQQQPVAADLRLISTALKLITDMERIGDHAEDISEITLRLAGEQYTMDIDHLNRMAKAATGMVKKSVDAFVARDKDMASEVIADDDVIDALFDSAKTELIRLIQLDAANGEQAVDFLLVAKYFERIGDHAVNIAQWVIFSVTGEHKRERIL